MEGICVCVYMCVCVQVGAGRSGKSNVLKAASCSIADALCTTSTVSICAPHFCHAVTIGGSQCGGMHVGSCTAWDAVFVLSVAWVGVAGDEVDTCLQLLLPRAGQCSQSDMQHLVWVYAKSCMALLCVLGCHSGTGTELKLGIRDAICQPCAW